MALRWIESWDSLATADIATKYDSLGGSPTITANGRTGANALTCTDSNTQQSVTKVLTAQATWIVGFAFNLSISGGDKPIFSFDDGATSQVSLGYKTGTGLLYFTGPFGTALSTLAVSSGVWYYIEIKVTIGNSGSYEVRVNEVVWITGTGDTQTTGNASADRIRFLAGGSTGTSTARRYDDVYVLDGTGSAPLNDYLGDCKVENRLPNNNGNSSQWVGSDGNSTDNYLLVDEATPNSDTDYVVGSNVGDKDTYAFQDLATTVGTVYGVQINPIVRKDDAGTRKIVSVARLSGTEVDSAASVLSTTYLNYPDIRTAKPGGGTWTITDVNNAEFGIKVDT